MGLLDGWQRTPDVMRQTDNPPTYIHPRTPQRVGPAAGKEDAELTVPRRVAQVWEDEPLPPRRVRLGLGGWWVGGWVDVFRSMIGITDICI